MSCTPLANTHPLSGLCPLPWSSFLPQQLGLCASLSAETTGKKYEGPLRGAHVVLLVLPSPPPPGDKAPASPFHFPPSLLLFSSSTWTAYVSPVRSVGPLLSCPLAPSTRPSLGSFGHGHVSATTSIPKAPRAARTPADPALLSPLLPGGPSSNWKPRPFVGRPLLPMVFTLSWSPILGYTSWTPGSLISCLIFKAFFVSFLDYYISLSFLSLTFYLYKIYRDSKINKLSLPLRSGRSWLVRGLWTNTSPGNRKTHH